MSLPRLHRRAILALGAALSLPPLRPARAEDAVLLGFDSLYKSFGVLGYEFADHVVAARGKMVSLIGYMAPPLKVESAFFVLTRQPLAICPFCQSDADWPVDIAVIYLKDASALVSAGTKVRVTGRLEIGSWTDPQTGFVSQLRIVEARYHGL